MDYKILRRLAFRYYNKARVVKVFDRERTNKALGLVLSGEIGEKIKEYGTTSKICNCPDSQYREYFCKHKIAFMINQNVWQDVQEIFYEELPL